VNIDPARIAALSAPHIVIPQLVDPVSPSAFGAKCDGITDDSAAFQAALDAGDVKVPPGVCVINKTVEVTVSDRHLECSPGTTLKETDTRGGRMFNVFSKTGDVLVGDSIVNCNFVGNNTSAPRYFNDEARHYNIPVQTQDRVFGQSMFQTYGRVDGGTGDIIAYNTFRSCGYYGPVFVAHKNGYMGHNVLIDCAVGVENDNAGQSSGGNLIEYNVVRAVHGYGAPDMNSSVMLTGGVAGEADYSSNVVRYNSVQGTSDAVGSHGAGLPSMIYEKTKQGAQYWHNTCDAGCVVIH
jgi:hypothetical protein